MAQFPALKTGAILQYPAERRSGFSTAVVRFLDGSEQRFRERKTGLRRWAVRLELLTDSELAALEEFFASQQGRQGEFEFADPWDGTTHPKCCFASEEAVFQWKNHERGSALVFIQEKGN
ncbi:MAG: DUF2460 domain-containing protein [Bryobacteraceae bacterium]